MPADGAIGWRWEAALAGVAAILFFTSLDCPLQEPEEPRYAEIPRQMLAQGSWLVPVLHGQAYYDKPPLLYWMVMTSYTVFGVHDWSARLPAALAGFLSVLVAYGWGRAVAARPAAIAGAFVLCLDARFLFLSHLLTMNGLLCLCVTAALAAAHAAIAGGEVRWRWWLASALACGLGVLAKGPVALVLVLGPTVLFAFWARVRIGGKAWASHVALAAAVAAPWFIAVAVRDPDFIEYFFWKHHVERYVAPFDHAKPVWYYVPDVLLGMLPWTLVLPFVLRRAWATRHAVGAEHFFLLAGLFAFAFFSTSGSKRAGYILPAMPPLALALGSYLATLPYRRTILACGAVTLAALAVANLFVLPWYATRFALRAEVCAADAADLPVYCYPHRWDSVSFYLGRNDVAAFRPEERAAMVKALRRQPRSLVIVKNERALAELLEALPDMLEFVPCARGRIVTSGWVCRRGQR